MKLNEYNEPERVLALAQHLGIRKHLGLHLDEIEENIYNDCEFEAHGGTWLVLTDSEADEHADSCLDSYIDEGVLPEVPESLRHYFAEDRFKQDVIRHDGRGHVISGYDGDEHEENVKGTDYYIYRTN